MTQAHEISSQRTCARRVSTRLLAISCCFSRIFRNLRSGRRTDFRKASRGQVHGKFWESSSSFSGAQRKNCFFLTFVTIWLIESLITDWGSFSSHHTKTFEKFRTWTESQITATDLFIPSNISRPTSCALADASRRNGSEDFVFSLFYKKVRSLSLFSPKLVFSLLCNFFAVFSHGLELENEIIWSEARESCARSKYLTAPNLRSAHQLRGKRLCLQAVRLFLVWYRQTRQLTAIKADQQSRKTTESHRVRWSHCIDFACTQSILCCGTVVFTKCLCDRIAHCRILKLS